MKTIKTHINPVIEKSEPQPTRPVRYVVDGPMRERQVVTKRDIMDDCIKELVRVLARYPENLLSRKDQARCVALAAKERQKQLAKYKG